ncbi:MAG: hypothetical protein AAFX05_07845 [Planctomycetota bacterium]
MDEVDRARATDPDEPIVLHNVTCVFANADEPEKVRDFLDDALTFGINEPEWLPHDPDMDPHRDRPRFKALLERLGA